MSTSSVQAPGPPTEVIVDSTTSTTISLKWTGPSGTVNDYMVAWMGNGSMNNDNITGGDSTSYTINQLESNSSYTITVTATNAAGSAVSDSVTAMTLEAGEGQLVGVVY